MILTGCRRVFQEALNAEIPLAAFLGLMHLRIPLPVLVLSGTGNRNQGGIDGCALLHSHAALFEMGCTVS